MSQHEPYLQRRRSGYDLSKKTAVWSCILPSPMALQIHAVGLVSNGQLYEDFNVKISGWPGKPSVGE